MKKETLLALGLAVLGTGGAVYYVTDGKAKEKVEEIFKSVPVMPDLSFLGSAMVEMAKNTGETIRERTEYIADRVREIPNKIPKIPDLIPDVNLPKLNGEGMGKSVGKFFMDGFFGTIKGAGMVIKENAEAFATPLAEKYYGVRVTKNKNGKEEVVLNRVAQALGSIAPSPRSSSSSRSSKRSSNVFKRVINKITPQEQAGAPVFKSDFKIGAGALSNTPTGSIKDYLKRKGY